MNKIIVALILAAFVSSAQVGVKIIYPKKPTQAPTQTPSGGSGGSSASKTTRTFRGDGNTRDQAYNVALRNIQTQLRDKPYQITAVDYSSNGQGMTIHCAITASF